MINVAVAVIFNAEGKLLISERTPHQYAGGLWEFPGGKVEANESIREALDREIHEELNIHILAAHPWLEIHHDYPDRSVFLSVWLIDEFRGDPEGMEGQKILWVDRNDLANYSFPDGNDLILKKIADPNHPL